MHTRTIWSFAALALAACSDESMATRTTTDFGPPPQSMSMDPITAPPAPSTVMDMPAAPAMDSVTGDADGVMDMPPTPADMPMAGSDAAPMTPPEEQPPAGPLQPIIPPIDGDCPDFTSGTKTVNGLSGISFEVGTKVEGPPTGPLVFYWHGTGSTASEGRRFPGTDEIVSKGGVFVAFSRSTGSGGDCSGTGTFSHDDFKIADQIVACAVRDHNIDPRQIYATGCSAGGLFSGCMAIERSSYLAATVPNSGGITIGYGAIQDPTRVPAVMTMHGGGSDVVIVRFEETSKAYDSHMLKLGSPMVINCDHGGGHCAAPGTLYDSGWEFMKAHPFGTLPSPYEGGLPADFHSSCEIWSDTSLTPFGGDPTEVKVPVTGEPWTPPDP